MEDVVNAITQVDEENEFDEYFAKKQIPIRASYMKDPKFDYQLKMIRINLDRECERDINTGNGFVISDSNGIKKDIKDENGLFSPKFGQTLGSMNTYSNRWRCECGMLEGSVHKDMICPYCNTPVKFIGDNYQLFGWIRLNNYYIIHPNLYSLIEFFCGPGGIGPNDKEKHSKLYNMIKYNGQIDQDGNENVEDLGITDQPFYGIGMIDFYNKFDDIMTYYLHKYPAKIEVYNQIYENRDKIFTHSLPVFTSLLRPFDVHGSNMYYEPTNAMYNLINSLAGSINRDDTQMSKKKKPKNDLLFDMQIKIQELYEEIIQILSGKKGELRQLIGGRCNFSSRSVIAQDPDLRIDQIKLPYIALAIMLQQKICNILCKTYNIGEAEAYNIWFKAVTSPTQQMHDIIMSIIHANPNGLPCVLNRNPTIAYGSILQMYCIGINDNYTISIPLQILRPLAADQLKVA
jgi:hypothetical protein